MFVEQERECANSECKKLFIAKVYNTIYCSSDCRKKITNQKLLENYYRKKENRNKKRTCKTKDCNTVLSKYNEEDICELCKTERYIQRLVSWGWDEQKLRNEL